MTWTSARYFPKTFSVALSRTPTNTHKLSTAHRTREFVLSFLAQPLGLSAEFLGNSVCNLPLTVGTCTAPVTRYYYDSVSGQCKVFKFSGCNGNANNFQSLSSCQATCSYLGE